ncbi:S8 family serine peptidase [Cognaticolwellia aestuarii]|uniref:S8 family serine peptidase n=1 Tax=Cognaticolwellia aestuarii TaxID=329993 RepID=UPI0009871D51|nr:S8 family serine peptidase [Cognaticolwellia aestuarii]
MIKKISIAVSTALYVSGAAQAGGLYKTSEASPIISSTEPTIKAAQKSFTKKHLPHALLKNHVAHTNDAVSDNEHTYIITFVDAPVATYKGGITGLAATKKTLLDGGNDREAQYQTLTGQVPTKTKAKKKRYSQHPDVIAYKQYLDHSQKQFIVGAEGKLKRKIDLLHSYQLALNGIAIKITAQEAKKLQSMPGIARVEREVMRQLNTDTGPTHIGAADLWSGMVNGLAVKGEGVTVGIIDTGINTDHISFEKTGDDDYEHTKPNSNYVGDCVDSPELCNDKLIGVFSYSDVTSEYAGIRPENGEDYNGHGSHTASTVAGNVLKSVPLLSPSSQQTNDGYTTSDFSFPEISGVAPHANIISFQVCFPGDPGDTLVGCFPSLTVQAVEDAIANDVDVINYSIGGGSSNPWDDADAQAFLSAREAGIVVVSSAGNSGPNPETVGSPADSPWLTSVGAFTHGRTFERELSEFTGGSNLPTENIIGLGQPGRNTTAEVVYAGHEPYNDPMCLSPLTAVRVSQKIVVCDRGEIPLVEKAENVFQGGGRAIIIANTDPENDSLHDTPYRIDGIHVDYASGELLRNWLSPDTVQQISLSAGNVTNDVTKADQAAEFSSRGPNLSVADVIVPSIAAPGVSIYAAYADDQPFKSAPGTTDFAFLSGTSMASPHVAGAAALLTQLHPDWTASDIHSTLQLTANNTAAYKEDGTTLADPFDNGSGMVRVDLAAKAGLSLRESIDNFTSANPDEGGDPSQLNIASLGKSQCVGTCSWTRTFTALKSGSYSVSVEDASTGLVIEVSPAEFTVNAGETQVIEVSADVFSAENNSWSFANINLTPTEADLSSLHLPLAAYASLGNLPEKITIRASRNTDSYTIKDRQAVAIEEFTARSYGLIAPETIDAQVAQDTTPDDDLFEDLSDGANIHYFDIPEGAVRFIAEISKTTSTDLDMVLGMDNDGNSEVDLDIDSVICVSAEFHAFENCELMSPPAGRYWVVVNNYKGTAAGAIDSYTLSHALITRDTDSNVEIITTESSIDQLTPFDISVTYNHESSIGTKLYGAFDLGPDASTPGKIGLVAIDLVREKNDISLNVVNANESDEVKVGDTLNVELAINKNFNLVDREYNIDLAIPDGLTLIKSSLPDSVSASDTGFSLSYLMPSQSGDTPGYTRVTNAENPSCKVPDLGQGEGYINLVDFDVYPDEVLGSNGFQTEVLTYFPNEKFHFFGEDRNRGMGVSEDGFVFFDSETDLFSFSNQALPDPALPNDAIALLWRDLKFDHNIDPNSGDLAGISVAKATDARNQNYAVVEWQNGYGFFDNGGYSNFELIMKMERDLAENAFEIILAYDDMVYNPSAFFTGTTVGLENKDATWGDTFVYKGFTFFGPPEVGDVANLTKGLVICYDVNAEFFLPATINFQVQVDEKFAGASIELAAKHSVNLNHTDEESATATLKVKSNLSLSDIEDVVLTEDTASKIINIFAADADNIDNTISIASASGQLTIVDFEQQGNNAAFIIVPNPDFYGFDQVIVTVSDNNVATDSVSTTFNVTVEGVNDAPSVSLSSTSSNVKKDENFTLIANAFDIDDTELSYMWQQTAGTSVNISSPESTSIQLTAPKVKSDEKLTFAVTVTDVNGEATTSSIDVNVKASKSSGSFGWLSIFSLVFLIRRKRK